MKTILKVPCILFVFLVCSNWLLSGCKDTEATHTAGLLETCEVLLNERSWTEAIVACSKVRSDKGKHLTAIAYMGRSGLVLSNLLVELSAPAATPTNLIFDNIPDTDTKVSDYKKALQLIMGEITVKDNAMYMEGILLSSLLIFKELKTLLGLSLMDGEIQTCAGEPADLNRCTFAPTLVESGGLPDKIAFSGLGRALYDGICSSLVTEESTVTVGQDTATTIELVSGGDPYPVGTYYIPYDVNIYIAPIAENSVLYYNKIASAAYAVEGTEDLSSLDFYEKMDTGSNFSIDVDPLSAIQFCKSGIIEPPVASDDSLNDCEVLSFLQDPGF